MTCGLWVSVARTLRSLVFGPPVHIAFVFEYVPSWTGVCEISELALPVVSAAGKVLTVDVLVVSVLHHWLLDTGSLNVYFLSDVSPTSATYSCWSCYQDPPRSGIVMVADDAQHFIVSLWATVYPT